MPNTSDLISSTKRVAFVSSEWHKDLVDVCTTACYDELSRNGVEADSSIDRFTVPGSLEIPLFCRRLAQSGKYVAIITFGLIVNGGIYRHEFVAQAVLNGIMQVQLETGTPILSSLLTPINFHEHAEHHAFFARHLAVKGAEVGNACLGLLKSMDGLESSTKQSS